MICHFFLNSLDLHFTYVCGKLQREHKGKDGVSILPALLRPKSTGTIRLASTNHHDHPLIDPQYLKHQDDVKTLVEALKIVKNIYDSKHFRYDFSITKDTKY